MRSSQSRIKLDLGRFIWKKKYKYVLFKKPRVDLIIITD